MVSKYPESGAAQRRCARRPAGEGPPAFRGNAADDPGRPDALLNGDRGRRESTVNRPRGSARRCHSCAETSAHQRLGLELRLPISVTVSDNGETHSKCFGNSSRLASLVVSWISRMWTGF